MTLVLRKLKGPTCDALILLLASIALSAAVSQSVQGQLQSGSVSGKVYVFTCQSDVVPLSGATVSATLIQTGATPLPATTDSEGMFYLTLAPGEYKLFVLAELFQTQDSYSFTIGSGTVISDFNFYLYAATQVNCFYIQYQNFLFKLPIYSNSSTGQVTYDSNLRQFSLAISVPNESVRKFLIVVPKPLLDGTPVVFVDNTEFTSTFIEGGNYFYVRFDPSVGSHDVMVRGSKSIPEFFGVAQISTTMLSLILAACFAAILKSRHRNISKSLGESHGYTDFGL